MWKISRLVITLTVMLLVVTVSPQPLAFASHQQISNRYTGTKFDQEIESFINNLMTKLDITTGTSIAIVKHDNIIYQQTFGFADIENNVPATNETLFYVASITKPMFALTLLKALEHSSLDLNYTLAAMFPQVKFDKSISAEKVTIRHLLSHTSGLDDTYLTTAVAISGIHTQEKKFAMLAALSPSKHSKLGEFNYTNLGYNILGTWFEKAFAVSWQDYMKQQVFLPLQMKHSTAYRSEAIKRNALIAQPYSFFAKNQNTALYLTKQDNTLHAAGGVLSTSTDMANFLKAQLAIKNKTNLGDLDSRPFSRKLIALSQGKTATVASKHGDFMRSGYALGWYTGDYKGTLTYHHFGAFHGFRPHISFMPEVGIGIVILNNEGMLNDKLTDIIADYAYSKLLGEQHLEKRINDRITTLKTIATSYREKLLAKERLYDTLPWQLNHSKEDYTGVYSHPLAGKVKVMLDNNRFEIRWGNLTSFATAYKTPEVMRVKLRPTRAQLITFDLEKNSPELTIDGIRFIKFR